MPCIACRTAAGPGLRAVPGAARSSTAIGSLADVEGTLERLIARELVRRLPRRAGQKEQRYEHALGEGGAEAGPEPSAHPEQPARPADSLAARLDALEERVSRLETAGLPRNPD